YGCHGVRTALYTHLARRRAALPDVPYRDSTAFYDAAAAPARKPKVTEAPRVEPPPGYAGPKTVEATLPAANRPGMGIGRSSKPRTRAWSSMTGPPLVPKHPTLSSYA